MTPQEVIDKWTAPPSAEQADAQTHFRSLWRLLAVEHPTTAEARRGLPYVSSPADRDSLRRKGNPRQ